ncbi:hypothetical protein DL546_006042 [Coniochaeta pulveracea]|uniref:Uncharacterized protein n=1 Tax=Coniochaeta pulveracea TaxID=177199 RepID=A0A420Y8L2_9PEZI|nr:hypothetical protein DL546_006042 [Coniochaeta pulveracea]
MPPKRKLPGPSAAEVDDAAADFKQFQARVPDKPHTTIGSAPTPVAAQGSSSGATKKKPAARKAPAKKATARKAPGKKTVPTLQADNSDPEAEFQPSSSPKGKGKAPAKAKGKRTADEAGLDAAEPVDNNSRANNGTANKKSAPSSSQAKGKAANKPRPQAKPRAPSAKRRKTGTTATATKEIPGSGTQTDPTILYFVFTTTFYPEKSVDRAEAVALHYTQRGPIPQGVMDAFIYGEKLGKPWASKNRKYPFGDEEPENNEETASQNEAKRRKIIREGKRPERASGMAVNADLAPTPAANTPDGSSPDPNNLGSSSPSSSEVSSNTKATSKRKHHDDDEAEVSPPSTKKRRCLSEHNLRELLMETGIGPESARIPNQLKKKPDEFSSSSSSSSSPSSGPISSPSPPYVPSLGSDELQVQGVPLLSRLKIERECVVFDTLDSANLYAMDEMLALAKPPKKARPEEKITYQRDIVEFLEEQYRRCVEDAEPDEFGDRTVTLELEPNVCHYRWKFFSAEVKVMRMVLPNGSVFEGSIQDIPVRAKKRGFPLVKDPIAKVLVA